MTTHKLVNPDGSPYLSESDKQFEKIRTLVDILTQQNKIMKDILRYQGMHDVEKIFYDCPLPYKEDLSTPLGYNAPNISTRINKNVGDG